jgi:hypothetical protein
MTATLIAGSPSLSFCRLLARVSRSKRRSGGVSVFAVSPPMDGVAETERRTAREK